MEKNALNCNGTIVAAVCVLKTNRCDNYSFSLPYLVFIASSMPSWKKKKKYFIQHARRFFIVKGLL